MISPDVYIFFLSDGAYRLCRAVHRARLPFIVFLDIPPEQATLPTSLFQVIDEQSSIIVYKSRKNFEHQKDNLFTTTKLYEPDDRDAINKYDGKQI